MESNYVLIEQSHEFIKEPNQINKVAHIAHNCYQVKDKDYDNNVAFLSKLINNKHFAMLEHATFCFKVTDEKVLKQIIDLRNRFILITDNIVSYSLRTAMELIISRKEIEQKTGNLLILALDKELQDLVCNSVNIKLKKETNCLTPVDPLTLPLEMRKVHLFLSYALVTNRGVTHELVRHRLCAFAQESTRYCNYTKDKFSNELTFIKPIDYDEHKAIYDKYFKDEADTYFKLIEEGSTPDKARSVLCNALKARIIITCSVEEWEHIFELRCSPFAHEDIRNLLLPVKKEVEELLNK